MVARKHTRKLTPSGFSSDDEHPEDRENGLGDGGRLPDRTVKVYVERFAKRRRKKSGWKINMGRGGKIERSLEKNEKQPH